MKGISMSHRQDIYSSNAAERNRGGWLGSPPKVGSGKFKNFVASAVHDGFDHVKREPLGHINGDFGRHSELPIDHRVNQHRPS